MAHPTNILNQLVGLTCSNVKLAEPGILVVFLEDPTQTAPHTQTWRLFIECTWKIADAIHVIAGSFDESHISYAAAQQLKERSIVEVKADYILGDICITFQGTYNLIVFAYAIEFEQWQLRRSDGYRLTVGPNMQWIETHERPDVLKTQV